jgi:hypothetical protein
MKGHTGRTISATLGLNPMLNHECDGDDLRSLVPRCSALRIVHAWNGPR